MAGEIDAFTSLEHYAHHVAPIWNELGDHAGKWYRSRPPVSDRLTVVAGWRDARLAIDVGRRVVLLEHGAGQTYVGGNSSYVGGRGRDELELYLAVNERSDRIHRRATPTVPSVVIGSPRVDELRALKRQGPPTVAISFHWRCQIMPESNTALDHYRPHLANLGRQLELEGIELIGHAHPRIASELQPIYERAEIEFVPDFVDVVRRADCYAVDNSSTLFEFAALDRPVVVLNSPRFRRRINHGLRFWEAADVGVQCDDPSEVFGAFMTALAEEPERVAIRRRIISGVYPFTDGKSARRAVDAVLGRRKTCPVCGKAHAACGPSTGKEMPVEMVTIPRSALSPKISVVDGAGRRFRMTKERAKFLNLTPVDPAQAFEDEEEKPEAPSIPDTDPIKEAPNKITTPTEAPNKKRTTRGTRKRVTPKK